MDLQEELRPTTDEDFVPGTLKHPKEWGIWDTKANTWMGTTSCPATYGKRAIAQMMAQFLSERLEVPVGRHMAKPFTGANIKVENITPRVSMEEAMRRACEDNAISHHAL